MKKLLFVAIFALATMAVNAASPFVVVKTEFWGKRYFVLTDVNGVTYKINPPRNGSSIKISTKTGWYIIDGDARIVKYNDRVVLKASKGVRK